MAALLQDVGVDRGDTNVPVSHQGLDGMNVSERMCTDGLVDFYLEDGLGNG